MSATSQAESRVAHPVHGLALLVVRLGLFVTLVAGCVFPPSLSVDDSDGGVNSPPAITSIIATDSSGSVQALSDSGGVTFDKVMPGSELVVGLLDTDVDDTLWVYVYIDYMLGAETPARAQSGKCASSGERTRSCTVGISGLCPSLGKYSMTVQVFDRELANDGVPLYKSMTDKAGLTTNRSYDLTCQ